MILGWTPTRVIQGNDHYWRFLQNPCHVFSNLIDPRYIGKLDSGTTSVIVWWEGRTDFQNLRHVALKLFSLSLPILLAKETFRIIHSFTQKYVIVKAMTRREKASTYLAIQRRRRGDIWLLLRI